MITCLEFTEIVSTLRIDYSVWKIEPPTEVYERETNDNSAREIASTPNHTLYSVYLVKMYVDIENCKPVKVIPDLVSW
jgi:hypothetical protein